MLFNITTIAYFASMVAFLIYLATRSEIVSLVGNIGAWVGFLASTAAMGVRWYESYQIPGGYGRVPLTNLYESIVFFAWSIIFIYLIIDLKYKQRAIGAFTIPFAFMGMIWAQLGLDKTIEPLVPALQSNWLTYHVITCFLGYGAFAVACGVSIMYLIKICP
jgi:ABC-type transport system involved in cytochrome c biogenesis permease subunit